MLNKNQQERLQKINARLNRWQNGYVTKEELMQICGCKERTLKEDLIYMRDEYKAPIAYSRRNQGYHYTHPFDLNVAVAITHKDLAALETAVTCLSQLSHLAPFQDLRGIVDKLEKAVHFRFLKPDEGKSWLQLETVPYFRGGELVGLFMSAIRNQQLVTFRHQRFDTDQARQHAIVPYLIKEHRNRWYVIGWQVQLEQIRVFGLDRIVASTLQIEETMMPVPAFDADQYFKHSLGVAVYMDKAPEMILLSFTAEQGRYFKTLPFLPFSMEENVLVDSPDEFRIQLTVIINKELIYELARLGNGVKVLAPPYLQEELREFHLNALKHYGEY